MSDESLPVPDLLTERLRLRALEITDAPGLHLAYGNAHSMRFWDALPSRSLGETEARISRTLSASTEWHAAWAVLGRASGQFIGMVNYHARQAWNRRLAIGWILVPDRERHGYMHEAMLAFLSHCFDTLDTHRVEAEIEPANARSARLAERLGFQREGLLRDRLNVAGEPRSCWMYSLLRPEWKRS